MKLQFIFYCCFIMAFALNAQVGVGTTNPQSTLDIEASNPSSPANDDGILIPRMSNFPSSPGATRDGMLIFYTGTAQLGRGFYYWDNTISDWEFLSGAKAIDDLDDGKTGNGSVFLGDNVANSVTALAYSNLGVGDIALRRLTDGDYNVAIGSAASENLRTGNDNISIGLLAMSRNRSGNDNIAIGNYTGFNSDIATSGNIFIGNWAGFNEFSGGNKLYIENSTANSNNALIYGEFDNDFLRINGTLEVNDLLQVGDYTLPTSDGNSGEVLATDGSGNVSWQSTTNTPVAFKASASALQTISGNSSAKLAFDTENFDLQNNYDSSTYTFTAPANGLYRIHTTMSTGGNTQYVFFEIRINGTVYTESRDTSFYIHLDTLAELNTNDTVEIYCTKTNSGNAMVFSNIYPEHSYFEIVKYN